MLVGEEILLAAAKITPTSSCPVDTYHKYREHLTTNNKFNRGKPGPYQNTVPALKLYLH